MIDSGMAPKVNALFKLIPTLSQTFLVSLVIVAVASLVCSAILLSTENPAGWAFFVLTIMIIVGALVAWWKAQPDVDSAGAHPTTMSFMNGVVVSTDTRTLRNPQSALALSNILTTTMERQLLPTADGIVDSNLMPIPGSEIQAQEITHRINSDTQAIKDDLLDALDLTEKLRPVAQAPLGIHEDKP